MNYETDRLVCVIEDDAAHVQFKGPDVAEYSEASQLAHDFRSLIDEFEFSVIVINCGTLTFVTSTVLEAFVSTHLRCRQLGRCIRLLNPNDSIREVLARTNLEKVMPIFDQLEDALKVDA